MEKASVAFCGAAARKENAPGDVRTWKWIGICHLLILVYWMSISPAVAEYRIGAGDVVEIYVTRVPEMQRRVPVRLDGSISFPLLGRVAVAGLSPTEMEAKIQAALAAKVFLRQTPDGRQSELVIDPDEVTATVVDYRPIYVNGDVTKPGEYPYRPSMTVLQAVAVSGGYNFLRNRIVDPFLALVDVRSEYEAVKTELVREQARIWRIRVELGKDKERLPAISADAKKGSVVAQILKTETDRLATRLADAKREKTFLAMALDHSQQQERVLMEQQEEEEKGLKADLEELRKSRDLFERGTLTSPRVTDARRAVMLSATRKLQTSAQLLQVKRQIDELSKSLSGIDDKNKIELLEGLQDATVKAAALRAKLDGLREKLQLMQGRIGSRRGDDLIPQLSIIRQRANGHETLPAQDGTELQPGDVVEVTLELNQDRRKIGLTQPIPVR